MAVSDIRCADCGSTTRKLYCADAWAMRKHWLNKHHGIEDHKRCRVFRCYSCWQAKKREKKQSDHDRLVTKYDLTPEQYKALYDAQGGHCAIKYCHAQGKSRKLSIDHDHACAESHGGVVRICCVRGLLCSLHNSWLGDARDNPDVFASLCKYLWQPPAGPVLGTEAHHAANAARRAQDRLR